MAGAQGEAREGSENALAPRSHRTAPCTVRLVCAMPCRLHVAYNAHLPAGVPQALTALDEMGLSSHMVAELWRAYEQAKAFEEKATFTTGVYVNKMQSRTRELSDAVCTYTCALRQGWMAWALAGPCAAATRDYLHLCPPCSILTWPSPN